MKQLNKLIVFLLFISMAGNLMAQSAEKATAGTGKYRDMIYWLKWDMRKRADGSTPTNSKIEEGDYVEFTAPESGMTYRITVTNMSFPWNWENKPKILTAGNYNNYWLNNFQEAYYWPCPNLGGGGLDCSKPWAPNGTPNVPRIWEDKKIALLVDKCEVIFDLKITASVVGSGTPIKDFAFIVAGSESLATPAGDPVREEYYSLEILPNDGETTLQEDQIVQPVEAYKQVLNSGSTWSLKLESLFGTEPGTNTVKGARLKVTNPNTIGGNNGNGQGDLLLAATHVEKVRVGLKGGGSQHIALGIIDLLDFGDAPNTYETDPTNPTTFARHYTLPSLGGTLRTEDKTWTTEPTVEEFVQLEEPILGIGEVIDSEEEKQNPSANANGDDVSGHVDDNGVVKNDEDGIPGTKWFKNCAVPVKVHNYHHSKVGWLYTWFDENNNGVFDANEALPKIEVAPNFDGYKYLDFNTLLPGFEPNFGDKRIVRFRISYREDLELGDLSTSGEIEDHLIEFMVPVVKPAKKTVTCDAPTTTVNILNLPQTGWTIRQIGTTGSVLSSVDASFTYTGTTTETILTLSQGSYHLEISNNADNCAYEFEVLIVGDTDCDGIPDNIDLDDDNDGILDTDEGLQDADGDGIPDDRDDNFSTTLITITTGYDENGNPITETVMEGSLIGDVDGIVNNPDKGKDTDGDGTPDYLDNDSDNDGCPDALEGSGNIQSSELDGNGQITGNVGTNGVPNSANGGQGIGMSQDANINVCYIKAKDDVIQTPQDVPVNGNVLTNDDGTDIKITNIKINGTDYLVTPGSSTGEITIPNVGTITVNEDGTYTFTPNDNFKGKVPTIIYTVKNTAGETDTAELDITVVPKIKDEENDAPVANNDVRVTKQDTDITFNILDNDHDSDKDKITVTKITINGVEQTLPIPANPNDVTEVSVNIPDKGTLIVKSDGTTTFNPDADFTGEVPDVGYTIKDNWTGLTDTAKIKITVMPDNGNSVYANDDYGVARNAAEDISLNVLGNDLDPEGHTKEIVSVQLYNSNGDLETVALTSAISDRPVYDKEGNPIGTISIDEDGNLTFDGNTDFQGTLAIPYTIKDANGATDTATIYLTQLRKDEEELPIELVSFDATLQGNSVELTWVSATEINNDFYSIYKSNDGEIWEFWKDVQGAGNSSVELSYAEMDNKPNQGKTYYKLSQTDFDGTSEELGIRVVRFNTGNDNFTAYPNPTEGFVTIEGAYNNLNSLRIVSALGTVVTNDVAVVSVSPRQLKLDFSNLSNGTYFIHLDNAVIQVVKN